ncbi:MAG: UrcA family protein [Parasphingorhabdus sp.]|uniref:UrcA family protein n=1 Tax=Parasphingorhabdus sp. TaxID=2709688 RepID=UPI003297A70E
MTQSNLSKAIFAATALAVTATGFSAAANAQGRITKSVEVSYADLDLTSTEGQSALDGRIKGAVRKVCGGFDSKNLRDAVDHSNCMQEAKQSAKRAQVSLIARAEAGTLGSSSVVIGGS